MPQTSALSSMSATFASSVAISLVSASMRAGSVLSSCCSLAFIRTRLGGGAARSAGSAFDAAADFAAGSAARARTPWPRCATMSE